MQKNIGGDTIHPGQLSLTSDSTEYWWWSWPQQERIGKLA